jgi:hypothetical protein
LKTLRNSGILKIVKKWQNETKKHPKEEKKYLD